MRCPAPNDA
jgi:ADP-ribosylation factor-binding protein GGA